MKSDSFQVTNISKKKRNESQIGQDCRDFISWISCLMSSIKLIYYGLKGRYLSDTDHALDNSSILDKISIAYFIDYSSISDQQPFIV